MSFYWGGHFGLKSMVLIVRPPLEVGPSQRPIGALLAHRLKKYVCSQGGPTLWLPTQPYRSKSTTHLINPSRGIDGRAVDARASLLKSFLSRATRG